VCTVVSAMCACLHGDELVTGVSLVALERRTCSGLRLWGVRAHLDVDAAYNGIVHVDALWHILLEHVALLTGGIACLLADAAPLSSLCVETSAACRSPLARLTPSMQEQPFTAGEHAAASAPCASRGCGFVRQLTFTHTPWTCSFLACHMWCAQRLSLVLAPLLYCHVCCGALLVCRPNPQAAMAEVSRVLKPGGVFVASTFLTPLAPLGELIGDSTVRPLSQVRAVARAAAGRVGVWCARRYILLQVAVRVAAAVTHLGRHQ
jgi:hypothetical protein